MSYSTTVGIAHISDAQAIQAIASQHRAREAYRWSVDVTVYSPGR